MKKFLIIEDNCALRVVLAQYLHETFSAEVVVAGNYLQVRAAARSGPFDVVVQDLVMDGASAGEIVTELRGVPGNECTPIVLMSAFHPDELAKSPHPSSRVLLEEVKSIGARAYLVKPFQLALLKEAINDVLSGCTAGGDRVMVRPEPPGISRRPGWDRDARLLASRR